MYVPIFSSVLEKIAGRGTVLIKIIITYIYEKSHQHHTKQRCLCD
jgi:hypothetical protein